jgi:hypothetical protein
MGTTLTGTTPQDTYDSLIKVTDNGPLSGTLKALSDGLGNDSTLSLSTTAASIAGTLAVTGNATFDTNTLFVDAANDRVGIGMITPAAKLDISQSNQVGSNEFIRLTAGAATSGALTLGIYPSTGNSFTFIGSNANFTSGGLARINSSAGGSLIAMNTDSIVMYVSSGAADPVERVSITSTGVLSLNQGQIKFPATQVASADVNTLDDYEEGTWTMGVSFGGASVGVTSSSNTGTYTKIGRQVTVNAVIFLTSKGSSTGDARITGLPFTIPNSPNNYSSPSLYFAAINFTNQFQGYGEPNTTTIALREITLLGTESSLTNDDFANNSTIIVSFTYFV